jgi:hypothetical protein
LVDFNNNVVNRKRGHERSPSPSGRKRRRSSSSSRSPPFSHRSVKCSDSRRESFVSPR